MRLAEEGGFEIDAGYAVQYALAQAPAVEVGDIAPKRRLAVGATVEIVEEYLRDFDLRSTAEILDVNDAHCFIHFLAVEGPNFHSRTHGPCCRRRACPLACPSA